MTQSRKRRGRKSELILAEYLRRWFPHVRPVNTGSMGADLEGTPGMAVEVKARAKLDLPAWLRQTRRNARGRVLPVLVCRLNGQGPASVGEWVVCLRLDEFMELWADEELCRTRDIE